MRIMLVQPKMGMRPMDTRLKTRMSPALSLLSLVSLTPEGHEVFIVNENLEDIDFDAQVDLVALTVTVDVLDRAAEISLKFRGRGVKVVAGGIHISASPDSAEGHFDSICVGMAERVWARMLSDAQGGTLEKVYRDMEGMSGAEIVSPAYEKIGTGKYLYTSVVSASRGCPFRCDFCYNSGDGSVRHIRRPVDDMVAEILRLDSRHVMFIDDNFIGDPAWAMGMVEKMKPLGLQWNCAVSANILKHLDLLDAMKESGCRSLFIGFESINNAALEGVKKRQNDAADYERLVSEIHARGMMINASLVLGLPEDGREVFDSTLEWLVKNKIETVTAHILTPYPGTALYKRMLSDGKIFDHNLARYNTANVVFTPEKMTPQELYEGYVNFYKKFYTVKSILRRLPRDKSQWGAYLLFNFMYRKWGKFTDAVSDFIPMGRIGKIASRLSYRVK